MFSPAGITELGHTDINSKLGHKCIYSEFMHMDLFTIQIAYWKSR